MLYRASSLVLCGACSLPSFAISWKICRAAYLSKSLWPFACYWLLGVPLTTTFLFCGFSLPRENMPEMLLPLPLDYSWRRLTSRRLLIAFME
jgi:hypothetical protein